MIVFKKQLTTPFTWSNKTFKCQTECFTDLTYTLFKSEIIPVKLQQSCCLHSFNSPHSGVVGNLTQSLHLIEPAALGTNLPSTLWVQPEDRSSGQ